VTAVCGDQLANADDVGVVDRPEAEALDFPGVVIGRRFVGGHEAQDREGEVAGLALAVGVQNERGVFQDGGEVVVTEDGHLGRRDQRLARVVGFEDDLVGEFAVVQPQSGDFALPPGGENVDNEVARGGAGGVVGLGTVGRNSDLRASVGAGDAVAESVRRNDVAANQFVIGQDSSP